MKKRCFYIAILGLFLSSCGAKSNVIQQYKPEKDIKLKYTLSTTPQADVPDAVLNEMRSQIQESLSARNLLSTKGDIKFHQANILITEYRMRPDAARLLIGIMAGCDTLTSKVTIVESSNGKIIGESEFESKECAAWGVAAQVIEAHIKKIIEYLSGDSATMPISHEINEPLLEDYDLTTEIILNETVHMGDDKASGFENPEPQGAVFQGSFDLTDTNISKIFIVIWVSYMEPKNSFWVHRGEYNDKLIINGFEVANLNKFIPGTRQNSTIRKIIMELDKEILRKSTNEVKIIAGHREGNYDDFQLHKIMIKIHK